jgi:hypothetical protein
MTRIILRALNSPLFILFVILGVGLQSSLFASWPLMYFQPDCVLLAVIWCALRRNFEEGGILTLIFSNIAEIHSAAPQGVYLISYMLVYLAVRATTRLVIMPTAFSFATVTMVSSIFWKLSGLVVLYLLGVSANQWKHTLTYLFLGAAVEGVFALFMIRWLDKFDWVTFKNARAEYAMDGELQLDSEGF